MCSIFSIFLGLIIGSLLTVDPLYPPNAISGATVVAEVQFVKGVASKVDILSGEKPFADSCKSALAQWRTNPAQDSNELIIVQFRQPNLDFLGSNSAKQNIDPIKPGDSLPYPKSVIEPAYPVTALGQGTVILRMDITAEGRIAKCEVVKSLGVLTDASIQAVRKWEFIPLKDKTGKKVPSHAYGVLVFRFPVITP